MVGQGEQNSNKDTLNYRGITEMSDESHTDAGSQFRMEIHAVIRRYSEESDLTVYQTLGALEVVKHDLINMMDSKKDEE